MDERKAGRLVGQDKYGNKYFEDPSQFYGRNSWVEYATHFNLEHNGSQIPAEWFGWMHYKTDLFQIVTESARIMHGWPITVKTFPELRKPTCPTLKTRNSIREVLVKTSKVKTIV